MKIHNELEYEQAVSLIECLIELEPKPHTVEGFVLKWTTEALTKYKNQFKEEKH